MTNSEAHAASDYLRPFLEAADRLANRGIVVLRLRADWDSFGSWVLEAQRVGRRGPVVRATFDGRDGALEVAQQDVPSSVEHFHSAVAALEHLEVLLADLRA